MAKQKPTATNTNLIEALLTPLDAPYTTERAIERMLWLAELNGLAEGNMSLAHTLVEITRRSFWAHLALLVWTHDEQDQVCRVKPFSSLAMYRTLAEWFDAPGESGPWAHPTIAIRKSRQLMVSWLIMARLDWCCIHQPHAMTFVVSEEQPKAASQVKRLQTIHDHYPLWYRDIMDLAGWKPSTRGAAYPNASWLLSLPQESGRSVANYVPTMGLTDEAAHQSHFEQNWAAIKGCCTSKAQVFAVSSVKASPFMSLFNDKMDGKQGGREKTLHESQGLSIWVNRLNGVSCASVHYTADPARRSAAWKADAYRGCSNKWQWEQEQEMREDVRGGRPIFRMLDRSIHVTAGHIEVAPFKLRGGGQEWRMRIEGRVDQYGRPIWAPVRLLRATDHGTSGYCATVWVAVDEDFDWFVYRTRKVTGWFAPQNAAAIAAASWHEDAQCYERYQVDVIDAMSGLPDRMGKVEDLYRAYVDPCGQRPLAGLCTVTKGAGSRQAGLDAIAAMLHSTMAAVAGGDHPYWREEGYEDYQLQAMVEHSSIYLGRDVAEPLFEELEKARWDENRSPDPEADRPETSLAMMDDLIDSLRYLCSSGAHLIRQKRGILLPTA